MNTLDARRRLLGRNVYKKTVEGNPAIAQGSLARRYPGIEMQGWTEQAQYEGNQLLDASVFNGVEKSGVSVSVDNGVITASGMSEISIWIESTKFSEEDFKKLKSGNIYVKNYKSSDCNYECGIYINNTFVSDRNSPLNIPEGYLETNPNNVYFFISTQAGVELKGTIQPMIYQDGDGTYEPYTGRQPSPSPDYPQEITSAGKYNEGTGKYEYEIAIANAHTDPDKNQTVTLTSDRPLTKWDKLEKRNGQWGWVYKSNEIVLDGNEKWALYPSFVGYNSPYILPFSATRREGYSDRGYVGYYSDRFSIWIGVNNSDIYVCFAPTYNADLEDGGVDNWKNFLSENPITIITYVDEETFVPLTEPEQEQMNALHTFRPTTVLSNDEGCEMSLTYKTKKSLEVAT